MNEELKKALEALRAGIGKNVEAIARIDEIEKSVTQGATDLQTARTEIDQLKTDIDAQREAIEETKREARRQSLAADPIRDTRRAAEIFGMQVRAAICRHIGSELPESFRTEADVLRDYDTQRATLHPGATTGSYLVPTVTSEDIMDTLEEISELLAAADFVTGLPGKMQLPTLTGRPSLQAKRSTVNTDMTAGQPTFGQLSFDPDEAYIFIPIDNRLIQMSAPNLGAYMNNLLRDSVIEGITDWLLKADASSTYNELTGILADATNIIRLPAGKKAFADLTAADTLKAKSGVLKRGRTRGVWLMSEEVKHLVYELDRLGKVPAITHNAAGQELLWSRPIVIDEGMPDLAESAANKTLLTFGDLATWWVGLVGGIDIAASTEYLFGRNQLALRAIVNMDIKRKPVKTLASLRTATS